MHARREEPEERERKKMWSRNIRLQEALLTIRVKDNWIIIINVVHTSSYSIRENNFRKTQY